MKFARESRSQSTLQRLIVLVLAAIIYPSYSLANSPVAEGREGATGDPKVFVTAKPLLLNQNCVVNILNRTVQVDAVGGWSLPNIPSSLGSIRARATCTDLDGTTRSGQSDFFRVVNNGITLVGDIVFENLDPVPVSLRFGSTDTLSLSTIGETSQLTATATFNDATTQNVTGVAGTELATSNANVVSVSNSGLITATGNGFAIITARRDGTIAIRSVRVNASGDLDGDGLPDDYEVNNGLNPNDPIDAQEDVDGDGLTALEEFNAGTNPLAADTDGDGVRDGEELIAGADGFITNPLLADSDGDGLSDGVEIAVGSDPNDGNDTNLEAALVSLSSTPQNVVMTFNGVDTEVSTQLTIFGVLIDGTRFDLTADSATSYASSDLTVASFGINRGEIFGGVPGSAVITVTNNARSVDVNVVVRAFEATALAAVSIPGYANNVDVSGDFAFIAAGAEGLQVVNVADREDPSVVASLDTDGTAIDIKVVGNTAYLADGEAGLKVIDVSNPLVPVLISSLDTAGITQDLAVQLDVVYLANGDAGIELVNIADPANPVSVSILDSLGNVTGISVEQDLVAVTGGSSLILIDVTDRLSPMRLGSINIGQVKDVVLADGYAHVAAYSQGYRVVNVTDPSAPRITGGDGSIAPRDVALTRNFAFYAEQLFPNVVAFINIFDLENPVFQGTINLSPLGDFAGTGIALDASYVYITEESFVVSSDFKASGNTRLFIAQYRSINDNNGVPPTVTITGPADGSVVVEGRRVVVTVDATDDVAVANVGFAVDGVVAFVDTSAPYQFVLTVPAPTGSDLSVLATAVDLGGNTASSAAISLQIQPDGDADGLGDQEEVDTWSTDPADSDSDDDGLLDGIEIRIGSNPNSGDTDGDGIGDQAEVNNGTDPTNPDVTPPTVDSSNPDNGATDVPENSSISVVFGEPLQAKSIGATVLQVIPDGSSTPLLGALRLVAGNTELLFTPSAIMQDFTLHSVNLSGLRDVAGNLIVPVQRSFTTGNFVDTTRPSIVDVSPSNGAVNVPLNGLIHMIVSEPIVPATVTNESFTVRDTLTGLLFDGVVNVSDDRAAITFTPNTPFLVGRRYQVVANTLIQDSFGNALFTSAPSFTTSFESDGTAPQVVQATVAEGATGIPLNGRFNVLFSEPISSLLVRDVVLQDSVGTDVSVVRTLSADKRILTLTPTSVLAASSNYRLIVDGVQDISGNPLPTPLIVNFSTGTESDTTRISILSWSYPFDALLPSNPALEVILSERIDPTTINTDALAGVGSFVLVNETQSSRSLSGQGQLSSDGTRLRFLSDELFTPEHQYRLYVTFNSLIEDLAGNRINGTSRRFHIQGAPDNVAPSIEQSSVANALVDLPVNASLVVRFDEPLSETCLGNVALTNGGTPIASTTTLSSDFLTITVNPIDNLAVSTLFDLSLNGLCDRAGNAVANTTLSVTTAGVDTTDTQGPVLQSASPANNSTGVALSSTITLTYDENLSLLTAPAVSVTSAGLTVPGSYSVSGTTVTFTPESALQGDTQYSINTTAVDQSNNSRFSGTFRFTTEALDDNTAPTLVSVAPAANAIDISPLADVILRFSEPMTPNTINANNIVLFANGSIISPSVFRSSDGREVTLSANLPSESVISVIVTDRVTDLSGNSMAALVSSFTTAVLDADGGRPSVVRQVPQNGSRNWIGLDTLVLFVNEPMSPSSIVEAFHISENGVLIDDLGTLEVLGNGQTIRFTKNAPFAEGALVTVFISDQATDDTGNPLFNYSGFFTMGSTSDDVGVAPFPIQYSNRSNLPLNPVLHVVFSEVLDGTTVDSSTVTLQKSADSSQIPVSVSLNTDPGNLGQNFNPGQIIRVVPQQLLDPGSSYFLRLSDQIKDLDGDLHSFTRTQSFFTGESAVNDDRSPVVVAVNPADGQTAVGVNPFFAVRFDESISNLLFYPEPLASLQFSEDNRVIRYARLGVLPASSEVVETLPRSEDEAGNLVAATTTTFNTQAGPDLDSGSTVDVSIVNGAVNVPLNPVLVREFSEPVDPVSLSENGVFLRDNFTFETVPSTFSLSADSQRVILVPDTALFPGRRYSWFSFSMTDISGNGLFGSTSSSFTTGFVEDITAPMVLSSTVFDGQTDVPTNVRLLVRFDEPMSGLTAANVQLLDSLDAPVPLTRSFSSDRRVITLLPTQLLTPNSGYKLLVGAIEDISGNPFAGPLEQRFTTGLSIDNVRGSVLNWSFAAEAEVPTNVLLQVTLSERIDPATINTSVSSGLATFVLDNLANNQEQRGEGVLSSDGKTLRFVPSQTLQSGTRYQLRVTFNDFLNDLAGNFINSQSRRFTVTDAIDNSAPQLLQSSIINEATDLPINSRLLVSFDEPLSDQCLDRLVLAKAGVPVSTDLALSSDRQTLTVTPQTNLELSSAYELTLNGQCDYAGNAIAGSILSFTTSASATADTTGPLLLSSIPAADASGVLVNGNISLTYNEPLSLLSAPVVTGAGVTVPGSYLVAGNTVTFTPEIVLVGDTQYSINTTVSDLAGNSRSSGTRRFTTVAVADATAPTVSTISPAANAVDVNPSLGVVLEFSEPMDPSTLNSNNILFFSNGGLISPSVTRSADGRQLQIAASLPASSVVSLVITERVTDLSGNAIAPFVSSFTTGPLSNDGSRPSIVRQIPSNGTTGWVGLDTLVLYANEPMDPASVAEGFHISENGVLIDAQGVLEVLGNGQAIRFRKNTPFAEGALVAVFLDDQASDSAGNALFTYSGFFTMASNDPLIGQEPFPVAFSSRFALPLNPVIQVQFSEPLNPATVDSTTVTLIKSGSADLIPVTVSLNINPGDIGHSTVPGRVIRVVPQSLLEAGSTYILSMTAAIEDTDGDTQRFLRTSSFTTDVAAVEDDRAPVILAFSPADGLSDVGINPFYAIRYDESLSGFVFGDPSMVGLFFSENNQVVHYSRLGTLEPSTEITESLPLAEDAAGNAVAATTSTFTTGTGPDLNNGSVVDVSIANGAIEVPINPILVRSFNEPIDPVSISDSGVFLRDNTTFDPVATTVALSADGTRLTLVPVAALETDRSYSWFAFSLRDLSNNGVNSATTSFTTGFASDSTGPILDVATIFAGQTGLPTNVRLNLRFNEPLSPLAVSGVMLLDDLSRSVPISITFSADRRTLTLIPTQLLSPTSSYTLSVSGVEDVSGNALEVAISRGFTTGSSVDNQVGNVDNWSFTADETLLRDVAPSLTLTEQVDPATVLADRFFLRDEQTFTNVPGTISISVDRLTLTFTPAATLKESAPYRLFISSSQVTDLAGNRINNTNRRFFTGAL